MWNVDRERTNTLENILRPVFDLAQTELRLRELERHPKSPVKKSRDSKIVLRV